MLCTAIILVHTHVRYTQIVRDIYIKYIPIHRYIYVNVNTEKERDGTIVRDRLKEMSQPCPCRVPPKVHLI